MNERAVVVKRSTRETEIELLVNLSRREEPAVEIEGVPFFCHLLHSMAYHGGFYLKIKADGDIAVDPHHLVEDVGLVFGSALSRMVSEHGNVQRFGHAVIPMDEALSEVTVDVCGRPALVYRADYPQGRAGNFELFLLREFFIAFANEAKISLHALCRYGENSHHMAEALFKALGRALSAAYQPREVDAPLSTKGSLG